MRNLILLLIAIIGAVYLFLVGAVEDDNRQYRKFSNSVNRKHNFFDEFIFSQSALYENYSLKFTKSDTMFMEMRFPEPSTRFYTILPKSTLNELASMLDTINLKRFDSLYGQDNLQDGLSLKFYFRNSTLTKTIGVYGNEAPTEIYILAERLDSLAKSVKKYPYDKKVDFGDLSGIVIPSPPPPRDED